MTPSQITHPIPPLFDQSSHTLILGSFPSVQSRAVQFFYGHKQNRFWRVIAALYGERLTESVEDKRRLILSHHLALWDTVACCEITGSADSSIRSVQPNDLSPILQKAPIRRIFVNGRTAERLYDRFLLPLTGIPAVYLPSTSPANAAMSLDRLIEAWKVITQENF